MDEAVGELQTLISGSWVRAVIFAVAILAVTAVVSHLFARLIRRVVSLDGVPLPSSSILVNIERIAVWALGVAVMLSGCFGIDVNALIAAVGVGGVALSLGVQDTLKNFIGGLQVTVTRIVEPGDHVVIDGIEGIVQDVTWRQTVVKDYENNVHLIPNSIVNSTTVDQVKPEHIVVTTVVLNTDGRSLDAVLRICEALAKEAVEKVAPLERDPWMLVTQIGEYGVWCKLRFVLAGVDHAREARDAALRAIAPYTRINAGDILPGVQEE